MKSLNPTGKSEGICNFKIVLMGKIARYNADKATVCADDACVTVYGQAARFVNCVVVVATAFVAIALIAKALRYQWGVFWLLNSQFDLEQSGERGASIDEIGGEITLEIPHRTLQKPFD
jgi:hypothetical protein